MTWRVGGATGAASPFHAPAGGRGAAALRKVKDMLNVFP